MVGTLQSVSTLHLYIHRTTRLPTYTDYLHRTPHAGPTCSVACRVMRALYRYIEVYRERVVYRVYNMLCIIYCVYTLRALTPLCLMGMKRWGRKHCWCRDWIVDGWSNVHIYDAHSHNQRVCGTPRWFHRDRMPLLLISQYAAETSECTLSYTLHIYSVYVSLGYRALA